MKIAVLGSGSFGCALAHVASCNNNEVFLWTRTKESEEKLKETYENPYIKGAKLDSKIKITSNLEIVDEVDIILFVVPSFALREVSQNVSLCTNKDTLAVICTKGLESGTMKSGVDIISEEIPSITNKVIFSGPTHAEELALGKITTIVSTSEDKESREIIRSVFSNDYLRVYTNADVKGVELLGAAKNVLAIAAGVCDSHPRLGDNAKAAILTRGLRELKKLGEMEDCDPKTFHGLTGLGDLMVTAMSQHSRNRKFGELVGTGMNPVKAQREIGMVVEGVYSIKALYQMKEKYDLQLPIIEAMYKAMYERLPIDEALLYLYENDDTQDD